MSIKVFPIKTKPATVCRINAIDKGMRKYGIRRLKGKHCKAMSKSNYAPPSDAMMVNVRKYNRGEGLARFA